MFETIKPFFSLRFWIVFVLDFCSLILAACIGALVALRCAGVFPFPYGF